MRKLLTISIVMLAVCTQGVAQEPPDLIAIAGAADKVLNTHDLDGWLSYFTDDAVLDLTIMPPPLDTKEKIKAMMEDQFAGSPDWHTTEARVFSVDNIVVVEHAGAGTNTGENSLGPATGNPWMWPHLDIYEFEGDKVKRLTTHSDYSATLIQLGHLPAPEMPELVPSFTLPDAEPTGLTPLAAAVETYARWNSKDLAHNAKMFHPDAEFFLSPAGVPMDKEAYTAMDELYLQAFSDRQAEILRMLDLRDGWVLSEVVFSGTHTGPYFGVPATGNLFRLRGAVLQRFDADGLITNHNAYYDNLTLMTQITQPMISLAGAWMMRTGTKPFLEAVTVTPQDSQGLRYTMLMEDSECNYSLFGMFPTATDHSHLVGVCVRTGPYTFESTVVGFVVERNLPNDDKILYQRVLTHSFRLVDENNVVATSSWAHYMPEQDADHDGFPDPGEVPFACATPATTMKRVVLAAPCVPPPPQE